MTRPNPPGMACVREGCPEPPDGRCATLCARHRREARGQHAKYHWGEAEDQALTEAYQGHFARKATRVACQRLGYPPHAVWSRAKALGLSRPSALCKAPWTAEEEAILTRSERRSTAWATRELRRAGFRRTPSAVSQKRRQMRVGTDGYTLGELAALLGVDGTTVRGWQRRGLLQATRRETGRTESQGDLWHVTHRAVRETVLRHPHLVDLRRVPPHAHLWFIDLCSGGAGLTVEEASQPLGSVGHHSLHGHELPG